MKLWSIGILLAGAAVSASPARAAAEKPAPAFYEKYLVESDPLDRQIRELAARIAKEPENAALRNDFGNLLARRGFAKEAAEQYRQASRIDRDFYLAAYNEGLLWEKEGKTGRAESAFRNSIDRKPGFPFSRFHLGLLYEKRGSQSAAVEQYAKALRLDNSLRRPVRNPLAVQTKLLYRASLVNYERDIAGAVLNGESVFMDPAILQRLSPEEPINAAEIEPEKELVSPAGPGFVPPPSARAPAAARPTRPAFAPSPRGEPANAVNPTAPRTILSPAPRVQAPPPPPEVEEEEEAPPEEEPPPSGY
jgi:tetratricopeptide (TPR) repeat protein